MTLDTMLLDRLHESMEPKEGKMITRLEDREGVWCPTCRVYCEVVTRVWSDDGEFLSDRCPKCDGKLPAPKKAERMWPKATLA